MGSVYLYRKSYLRYLCESQAYVEYDKVWTCQNSENKTNINCPDPEITIEEDEVDSARPRFFNEDPDAFLNQDRIVRSKQMANFSDFFWGY